MTCDRAGAPSFEVSFDQVPVCMLAGTGEIGLDRHIAFLQEAQSRTRPGCAARPRLVSVLSRDPSALATGSVQPLVTTVSIARRRYTPAFCKIMCRNRFLVPVTEMGRDPGAVEFVRCLLNVPEPGFINVRPVVADGYLVVDDVLQRCRQPS